VLFTIHQWPERVIASVHQVSLLQLHNFYQGPVMGRTIDFAALSISFSLFTQLSYCCPYAVPSRPYSFPQETPQCTDTITCNISEQLSQLGVMRTSEHFFISRNYITDILIGSVVFVRFFQVEASQRVKNTRPDQSDSSFRNMGTVPVFLQQFSIDVSEHKH
jgi:hypothetical protein